MLAPAADAEPFRETCRRSNCFSSCSPLRSAPRRVRSRAGETAASAATAQSSRRLHPASPESTGRHLIEANPAMERMPATAPTSSRWSPSRYTHPDDVAGNPRSSRDDGRRDRLLPAREALLPQERSHGPRSRRPRARRARQARIRDLDDREHQPSAVAERVGSPGRAQRASGPSTMRYRPAQPGKLFVDLQQTATLDGPATLGSASSTSTASSPTTTLRHPAGDALLTASGASARHR